MDLYKPTVLEFSSNSSLHNSLAGSVVDRILDVNAVEGVVRLAFSGGRSPIPTLELLSKQSGLPWEKVEIYQTDERWVSPDHENSNQKNLLAALGPDLTKEIGEVNLFNTALPIKQGIKNYSEVIDNLEGVKFDLLVLGVGPDGHIASLFPRGDYLKHLDQTVIQTTAPKEFDVADRASLALETILDTTDIFLIVSGEKKIPVLQELLEGNQPASYCPVKFLLAHPRLKIFYCGEE